MSDLELDDDVRELLLAERERPCPVDAKAKSRVLARMAVSMAGLIGVAATGGAVAMISTERVVTVAGRGGARAALGKLFVVSALSFVAGGGAHALYTASNRHVASRVLPVATTSAASPTSSTVAGGAESSPSADSTVPTVALSSLPAVAKPDAPTAKTGAARALQVRERALLEAAQSALIHGNASDALNLADRHSADFPKSELAEERDAIRVRAFAKLGRCAEARAALERFMRGYPESLQAQALERLCVDGTP